MNAADIVMGLSGKRVNEHDTDAAAYGDKIFTSMSESEDLTDAIEYQLTRIREALLDAALNSIRAVRERKRTRKAGVSRFHLQSSVSSRASQ